MFNNFNKNPVPNPRPMKSNVGCKIKVKRDSSGRITGYEDNGLCSSGQIKAFTENIDFKDSEPDDDE